jgi:hypothetical protein
MRDGGPGVIRTRDLFHAKEAIYRADLPAHACGSQSLLERLKELWSTLCQRNRFHNTIAVQQPILA